MGNGTPKVRYRTWEPKFFILKLNEHLFIVLFSKWEKEWKIKKISRIYLEVKIFNCYLKDMSVKKDPRPSTRNKSHETRTPIVGTPKILINKLTNILTENVYRHLALAYLNFIVAFLHVRNLKLYPKKGH